MAGPVDHEAFTKTPAQALAENLSIATVTDSSYLEALSKAIGQAREDLKKTVLGHNASPLDVQDFSYVPAPIRRLRELPDNWDGQGARRLADDDDLIAKAEQTWDTVVEIMPATLLPDVLPGPSGFITFSWRRVVGKNLQLNIFRGEDGQLILDWLLETRPSGRYTDEAVFDPSLLPRLVEKYLAA